MTGLNPLPWRRCLLQGLCGIRRNFFRLSHCHGQVAYVLLTRAPVAGGRRQASSPAAPRLAGVKPVASVHPEPGSNSPLLVSLFSFFFVCWSAKVKMSDGFEMFPAGGVYRYISNDGRNWQSLHSAASYEAAALSLVLLPLSIVNLSMFSIPLLSKMHSTILSAEMFCKVKANFSNHQIFREKFLIYFFWNPPSLSAALLRPFRTLPWCRSQKRVQSYNSF